MFLNWSRPFWLKFTWSLPTFGGFYGKSNRVDSKKDCARKGGKTNGKHNEQIERLENLHYPCSGDGGCCCGPLLGANQCRPDKHSSGGLQDDV